MPRAIYAQPHIPRKSVLPGVRLLQGLTFGVMLCSGTALAACDAGPAYLLDAQGR